MSLSKKLFNTEDQIKLLSDLHDLFYYGDSPQDVVDDFKKFGDNTEQEIATDIDLSLSNGGTFVDGLNGWIPRLTLQAMRVGEAAGNLPDACKMAKENLEASNKGKASLIGQMIQPVILIVGSLFATIGLASFLFPQIEELSPRVRWPGLTNMIYDFGLHMSDVIWIYLSILFVFPIILTVLLRHWSGRTRIIADSLPIFKQHGQMRSAELLNSLAQLDEVGININESLELIEETASPYMKWHLNIMHDRIGESSSRGNLGHLMDTGLIENRVISRLKRDTNDAIGDSVKFRRAASEVHEIFERSTRRSIAVFTNLSKLFSIGAMMIIFGSVLLLMTDLSSTMM
ncbi:type II secretion system F family protein [Vibrio agarivorans]|uniref:Type II secretion system F family protein n=1 Tax=Vibrio agarivorans TaxID=153622 RepID=A0ABT7Y7D8_9VIBR|nr:type II secretion system F family protein [Vibrio agarivorans]MDN2483970.1 type II secretion system F family protein [Vibrio agarivorans]